MEYSQAIFINGKSGAGIAELLESSSVLREVICAGFKKSSHSVKAELILPGNAGLKNITDSKNCYVAVTNGSYFSRFDKAILHKCLSKSNADIIAVTAWPSLRAYSESVKLTSSGTIAGFSRLFESFYLQSEAAADVTHHLFIKKNVFNDISKDIGDDSSFDDIVRTCLDSEYKTDIYYIAGSAVEVATVSDMTAFALSVLAEVADDINGTKSFSVDRCRENGDVIIASSAEIATNAVLTGPVIICENAVIEHRAIVKNSIVAPNATVKQERCVVNEQLFTDKSYTDSSTAEKRADKICENKCSNPFAQITEKLSCKGFKNWRRFSYPAFGKRIFDIFFSLTMIILFGPVWFIIIAAIKINSPGPIFYSAKRQGLRGKSFGCLKFRSMIVGADDMQQTLRAKNEVDGPQFKMAHDPRISSVGRFLRDTSLDEIPQFFNVLFGDMSVVGPRPSPEGENLKCPYWRDARLSVRPGITGLWQLKRTREPAKDFQEWVYYDTKYVREVSFAKDMSICFHTALMLIKDFLSKF